MTRQYFQAANQVKLTDKIQTSFETNHHQGTDFVFGVLAGYPCCTSNMHQSWPKFVQNLWYATADGGVAALMYAPSEVELKVADGTTLKVKEETGYPFRETINFSISLSEPTTFPFHLRIPSWASDAKIHINGERWEGGVSDQVAIIEREWKSSDHIALQLPMDITTSRWYQFATAIERGPLVYSLKVLDKKVAKNRNDGYGEFFEVHPASDWNYGLLQHELDNLQKHVEVVTVDWDGAYPWNLENAPVQLKMSGVKVMDWKLQNDVPVMPGFWSKTIQDRSLVEEITLVPYGCTTLRITEFPVYNTPQ